MNWREIPGGEYASVFPVNEPVNSAVPSNQECAVSVFRKRLCAGRLPGQRIEFWGTGLPFPQPVRYSSPEIALAVFMQREHSLAKTAITSVAMDTTVMDSTQYSIGNPRAPGPHSTVTVLKERKNNVACKLRIMSKLAVLQTSKATIRANPQCPVASDE